MLNQFFVGGKCHEIYRAEMNFSHVFHHVFHIIFTCITFDSVQISRYFIYLNATCTHAANEDWPRVCSAFLLPFGINLITDSCRESERFICGGKCVPRVFVWLDLAP